MLAVQTESDSGLGDTPNSFYQRCMFAQDFQDLISNSLQIMLIVQRFSQFLLSAHFSLGLMAASFIGVIFIVATTSPIALGPAGMLAAFGIFYVWFFALFMGGAQVTRALRSQHIPEEEGQRFITGRAVMLSAAWAFAPLIMLALKSIGQLDAISFSLVIIFEVLASVYIIRR